MDGGFDFADERRWPTPRLHRRFFDLREHLEQPLSHERKRQINDELTYIAFEGLMRDQEEKRRQAEIDDLEDAHGPFDEGDNELTLPFHIETSDE